MRPAVFRVSLPCRFHEVYGETCRGWSQQARLLINGKVFVTVSGGGVGSGSTGNNLFSNGALLCFKAEPDNVIRVCEDPRLLEPTGWLPSSPRS